MFRSRDMRVSMDSGLDVEDEAFGLPGLCNTM